jgi:protein phosphatase methylesterase 1
MTTRVWCSGAQLVLMPTAGHAIQEDEPHQTAEVLLAFLKRFRVGEPPLQFPRAAGVRPVLPVVAGPFLEQQPAGGPGRA